ncbi:RelA/SpoT domain-containing protein [Reyranella sp.]|uniref:RelA/SpoT domain-containing protein n=1 Tax=Reyranella sp. TaxID=1929291 RepID=UPI002731B18D|nr:RelA/SpoT domain-containing protein [Reyranella sp.]MDP2377628.1 RelA/SpoT domain-containing protein [Reyranella sp.]
MVASPPSSHSNKAVKRAGEALAGSLREDRDRWDEVVEVFKIAHEWRQSHAIPMHHIRQELRRNISKVQLTGITAARMKRMVSIRRKLRNSTTTLLQMQDIGGCRAIVESMADLHALVRYYRDGGSRHILRRETSYLDKPRNSGYRSHHFVLDYCAPTEVTAALNGRRIELQIRTQLQHSWATAVEAVGLVRREDMKAGEGDPGWLRLFELVSAEQAEAEGTPIVSRVPDASERRAELIDLNQKLDAIRTLQNLKKAFKVAQHYQTDSEYFLIQYDNEAGTVDVRGYNSLNAGDGADALSSQERANASLTTVLVEVAKMEDLRAAYPNYFGDVTLFVQNLRKIVTNSSIALQPGKGPVPSSPPDLSWVNTWQTDRLTIRRRRRQI